MSLEQVVRLLGDCGPPVYLYFISLPSGGWDRAGVTRQTRNLNLAEVVISNHQDLLSHQPLHSPTQVRSLSPLQMFDHLCSGENSSNSRQKTI